VPSTPPIVPLRRLCEGPRSLLARNAILDARLRLLRSLSCVSRLEVHPVRAGRRRCSSRSSKTSPSAMHRNWARTGPSYASPWPNPSTLWCSAPTTAIGSGRVLPRGQRDGDSAHQSEPHRDAGGLMAGSGVLQVLDGARQLGHGAQDAAWHQAACRTAGRTMQAGLDGPMRNPCRAGM
jgi:hypothetical protein